MKKPSLIKTLIAAISGRTADEVEEAVVKDQKESPGGDFLADFRSDRFAGGGFAHTGPTQYSLINMVSTNATTPTAAWLTPDTSGVQVLGVPAPAPEKVAKIRVRPKEVLAELGRVPTHWSLEGLDTKIEMMEAKRSLIQGTKYSTAEVDALLQCLRNRKKYDAKSKDGTTFREFFSRLDTTDHAKVMALCEKHELVLKDADMFIPEMPDEATRMMKAVTDRTMELCGKKPRLFVIATNDQFREVADREIKRDPIVLAQSPFGFYYYILGAWDAEMLYLPEL
jgi:hypothetical protein